MISGGKVLLGRFREGSKRLLKTLLGRVLFGLGCHKLLLSGMGVVVEFHRVNDDRKPDAMNCGTEQFMAYCRFFKTYFAVVPLRSMVDKLEAGLPLGGELAITFDDGYRDNAVNAAPILKEMDLHATFFVVSGFIGSTAVPYWDRMSGQTHSWMSEAELVGLQDAGFEVGSHSHTHADLGSIPMDQVREELSRSRSSLESLLGRPPDLFAYPFGDPSNITPQAQREVRNAGYRCCASGFGGLNATGSDPFELRRFPISVWYSSPYHLAGDILAHALRSRIRPWLKRKANP